VATVAGLALIILATRSGQTRDIAPHDAPYHLHPRSQPPAATQPTQAAQTPNFKQGNNSVPAWLHILLLVIGIGIGAAIAAAVIWYAVKLIRRLGLHLPDRVEKVTADFELAPEDVARALTEAVDATLVAIERGETRDAIIACWLRLEDIAAEAGVQRRPAETAADLTERVLATHQVGADTLSRLAELYREARFSAHHLDESARTEARSALEQVRAELAGTPESAT
jgi:hypothetical protein